MYISLRDGNGISGIGYNATTGTTCPDNTNTYCEGINTFSVVINGNRDIALTAYVSTGGGGLFTVC